MPVYVRRDVTPEVAMALRKPGMAVIEGPAGFGTRVAFEAMRGLRSSRRLIVPQTGAEIRKPGQLDDCLSNTVIWRVGGTR
jgi:hypothetical protein